MPPEALKYCISSCYYHLLWGLRDLEVQAEGASLTHSGIQNVRDKLDDFIEASQILIRSSPHVVIKEEAYVGLCDLLIVFSEQLQNQQSIGELVCRPDRNLQVGRFFFLFFEVIKFAFFLQLFNTLNFAKTSIRNFIYFQLHTIWRVNDHQI